MLQHELDHAAPEYLILSHDGQHTVFAASRTRIRVTDAGAYIETRLNRTQATVVAEAQGLGLFTSFHAWLADLKAAISN